MRVALKIAYDGRAFFGHQRQPDRRTVEGECLAALRSAKIVRDPSESFFRSASRTDRGVSAIGNVIAFDTALQPTAVLGALNSKAEGVWAWASAAVSNSFHPRHATERWYRYYVLPPTPIDLLREAASEFVGDHDFRWFTSDGVQAPMDLRSVDVSTRGHALVIDFRAGSFHRGMVRRIVSALFDYARGDARLGDIRAALQGERHHFGMAPAEPLVLMDVQYDVQFTEILRPKLIAEWRTIQDDLAIRGLFLEELFATVGLAGRSDAQVSPS